MTLNRLTVLFPVLLVILSGCIFSPKRKDADPPPQKPVYAIPASPEIALTNYLKAYESRDTTQMNLIYDKDYPYKGESIDQTQPTNSQTTNFTWADEVAHVAALARTPSISSVSLDFGSSLTRSTDLGDPPGWATIQTSFVRLEIHDSPTSTSLVTSGETIEFKFIPKTPDNASPTDTTWKIVQWSEFYNP